MKRMICMLALMLLLAAMAIPVAAQEVTAASPVTAAPAVEETEASIVDEIAAALGEYIPEIVSGGTLIGLVALIFGLKKNLIPSVKEAVAALFRFAKDSNEKNSGEITKIENKVNSLLDRFDAIAAVVEDSHKSLYAEINLLAESSGDLTESIVELLDNTDIPADAKAKIAASHEKHSERIAEFLKAVGEGDEK